MMIFDKKKAMATIMAKRHPDGSKEVAAMRPEVVKTEDGEMDGRHQAMQDFMMAHADKSPAKMMEAMSNFMDLHQAHKSKEEAEKPSED